MAIKSQENNITEVGNLFREVSWQKWTEEGDINKKEVSWYKLGSQVGNLGKGKEQCSLEGGEP